MTVRLPCTSCGELILPSTAEKTGGLCMPCKGGYRKKLEESVKRQKEEKLYRESAPWKHWCSLVERVHKTPEGLSGLSAVEQKYFAMHCLVGEIYNGGFEQYFSNSSADYYQLTLDGLMEIGATQTLRMHLDAKELIFGKNPVPQTQSLRCAVMPTVQDETISKPDWWLSLDKLDDKFYANPEVLEDRMEQYAIDHELRKNF